ncbi:MAG: glycosyltransferase [Phycisphaerales bacterium]
MPPPMNILHIITDLDPSGGGPPLVASRLAAAQAALGHGVRVLCYASPAAAERARGDLARLPGGAGVEVRTLAPGGRGERLTTRRARAAVAEMLGWFDVAHLHGAWEPILRGASVVARRHGSPYVVAPHGMLDPWALRQKALKKRAAMALGYGSMIRGAAFLHAMSGYEAACLRDGRFDPRVEVIPCGVFPEEFEPRPGRGAVDARHPQLGGAPYILFLARLHPVKGLDLLAAAFAEVQRRFPDVHVVVAGPDFGAGPTLREQVAALGIGSRFHLVGAVHGPDKAALFAHAALFTLPSEHESFGMSIAEAMACGLPVVISEECHFPDVASAGAGIIVKRTAADLARGLASVLADPARARGMGDAGRRLIAEKYTWPRVAARSVQAYEAAGVGGRTR